MFTVDVRGRLRRRHRALPSRSDKDCGDGRRLTASTTGSPSTRRLGCPGQAPLQRAQRIFVVFGLGHADLVNRWTTSRPCVHAWPSYQTYGLHGQRVTAAVRRHSSTRLGARLTSPPRLSVCLSDGLCAAERYHCTGSRERDAISGGGGRGK